MTGYGAEKEMGCGLSKKVEIWTALGKLLSYDFFHGTTEIIVADHITRSCETVIRLETLLQMKSIMPGKYCFPFFHSTGKLTYKITCLSSHVSDSSFLLYVGFCYLTIICYI